MEDVFSQVHNALETPLATLVVLLVGPHGRGKTHFATQEAQRYTWSLSLNASSVRRTQELQSHFRVIKSKLAHVPDMCIVMDEVDGLKDGQWMMLSFLTSIEHQQQCRVRFILCCNEVGKLNDALLSRSSAFMVRAPTVESLCTVGRMYATVDISEESFKAMAEHSHGDYRHMIHQVEARNVGMEIEDDFPLQPLRILFPPGNDAPDMNLALDQLTFLTHSGHDRLMIQQWAVRAAKHARWLSSKRRQQALEFSERLTNRPSTLLQLWGAYIHVMGFGAKSTLPSFL